MDRSQVVTIVSGMPRSGTSLMMQILKAAGMQLLVDDLREPDSDNPQGYFEFEAVKALARDASWLPAAEGKVVKVIYRLLPHLPLRRRYDIVFMERSLAEVLRSQERMVARLGTGSALDDAALERVAHAFRREVEEVRQRMQARPGVKLLTVSHRALLSDPRDVLLELCRFLAIDPSRCEAMRHCIDPRLYRSHQADREGSSGELERSTSPLAGELS